VFSGVYIDGEVDRIGNKGSGDTTMVVITTLLEDCGLDPEICLFR
jgi:hypothetical protein